MRTRPPTRTAHIFVRRGRAKHRANSQRVWRTLHPQRQTVMEQWLQRRIVKAAQVSDALQLHCFDRDLRGAPQRFGHTGRRIFQVGHSHPLDGGTGCTASDHKLGRAWAHQHSRAGARDAGQRDCATTCSAAVRAGRGTARLPGSRSRTRHHVGVGAAARFKWNLIEVLSPTG